MALIIDPIPILSDNYAWRLADEATGTVAVVDPADADAVEAALLRAGGRLDLILLTHHHADHVAGTDQLRARFDCPVAGAAADAYRLPALDRALAEGDSIAIGATQGVVIDTPGHTRGHISFFFADGATLVCGDTLFSLGCGRLLEGTAAEMFASLRKLAALPGETRILCGHEYTASNARFALSVDPGNAALQARAAEVTRLREAGEPTLPAIMADELAANPFLRAADVAALAKLRTGKDNFR